MTIIHMGETIDILPLLADNLERPFSTGPRHVLTKLGAKDEEATEVVIEDPVEDSTEGQYFVEANFTNYLDCQKQEELQFTLASLKPNVMNLIQEKNLRVFHWHNLLPIATRLQFFLENWQKITGDSFILQIIKGYSLELESQPIQTILPPKPVFSKQEQKALDEEVNQLLQKQAVEMVYPTADQFISHMFLVAKKDGGRRPIINLRSLNGYITYQHFKMEGLHMVKDLLNRNDWLCKIDLKDAYLAVNIETSCRKYLRFEWGNKTYQFKCLPFGLASAPRIYTKLMKPVISLLRKAGIRLIIYLDDILLIAESPEKLTQARDTTLFLLQSLGFVINLGKSKLTPCQVLDFLGFQINTQKMTFYLSKEKVTKLKKSCREVLSTKNLTVRELAKITGKLVSTLQAIIPANLQCRFLQMLQIKAIMSGKTFEAKIVLTKEAREELIWWVNQIDQSNGRSIITATPDLVLTTDASNEGWGAVCQEIRTGGNWAVSELELHINAKELLAAFLGLKAFVRSKSHILVHLRMDNISAVAYVNRMGGTKSKPLTKLMKEIWDWCSTRGIILTAEYLPGKLNSIADWESRNLNDSGDWMLDKNIFEHISNIMGKCQVDLFATRLNYQIQKFISWRNDPEAMAIDAFLIPWATINGYAFPPFCIIGRCLAKIAKERATILIITPIWQAQPWYPLLLQMSIRDPIKLPCFPHLLTSPKGQTHPLTQLGTLQLAAWKVSGNIELQTSYQNKLQTYTSRPGDQEPELHIKVPGSDGLAGAYQNKLIPFKPLWRI